MDFLLLKNPETLNKMSMEKRAEEKVLPEELSINDIALLRYPNDEAKQKALKGGIIEECKAKKLTYYGDINGWTWEGSHGANPHPKITNGKSNRRERRPDEDPLCYFILLHDDSIFSEAGECLIHRDNFKHYLVSMDKWTVKDLELLANWWPESESRSIQVDDDKRTQIDAYEKYKISLDDWRSKTGIDPVPLTVETIFKQVKQFDKPLWNIALATFRRDVWPTYREENGLTKQPGRPRKK